MGTTTSCTKNDTQIAGFQNPIQGQTVQVTSNNPFYAIGNQKQNSYKILDQYNFLSKYTDTFIGQCNTIQNKISKDLFLCKQFKFGDQRTTLQKYQQLIRRKSQLTSDNILKIREVVLKNSQGFLFDQKKILVIIDYPLQTIQKQIASRVTNKLQFSSDQVINFIKSTVSGYANIQKCGFKTDRVRLKNIFYGIKNKQPIIKVAQNSMIPHQSNYMNMYKYGSDEIKNRDIYLSPQQFYAWKNDNQYFQAGNKSGVYSLGMCILDLCSLSSSNQVYHFTQKQIDQVQLQNRIQITGKNYGTQIQKIIRQMLQLQPTKRISFTQLQSSLQKTIKFQPNSRMSLSIIPNQKSTFIHNDNSSIRTSQMFKSVNSQSNSISRIFNSRIKPQTNLKQELNDVHEQYTNGNQYKGQKLNNKKHGKGTYTRKTGQVYSGQWQNDRISGRGTLYFADGSVQYDGEWHDDLYHGWGILNVNNKQYKQYQGQFDSGVFEGRGRLKFKNGNIYQGQFRNGRMCGRGRLIKDNQVQQKWFDSISPQNYI